MVDKYYKKPNQIAYRLAQAAAFLFGAIVFKRKVLRNEIKGVKGPYVILANHQAAYDFVNLIGATKRRISFVISNSMYQSLPIKNFIKALGVIPKQQFQTSVSDMKRIRAVVEKGHPLALYPAGLMCEDGVSTPIPEATYKMLKWLGVDVYVAKVSGTYFAMPKWAKGFRPGRTYIDIYKLFSKEELAETPVATVREKTRQALLFDAYREQEQLQVKYAGGSNVEGLEHVLYRCPHCGSEFTIRVNDGTKLSCEACGYEEVCDAHGFLHNEKGVGPEYRYVSDWSRMIYENQRRALEEQQDAGISLDTQIYMIQGKKFAPVGMGTVSLDQKQLLLEGTVKEEPVKISVAPAALPSLPFSPGKYLEVQHGSQIYRCVLEDGKQVMKFINMLKAFHELSQKTAAVS